MEFAVLPPWFCRGNATFYLFLEGREGHFVSPFEGEEGLTSILTEKWWFPLWKHDSALAPAKSVSDPFSTIFLVQPSKPTNSTCARGPACPGLTWRWCRPGDVGAGITYKEGSGPHLPPESGHFSTPPSRKWLFRTPKVAVSDPQKWLFLTRNSCFWLRNSCFWSWNSCFDSKIAVFDPKQVFFWPKIAVFDPQNRCFLTQNSCFLTQKVAVFDPKGGCFWPKRWLFFDQKWLFLTKSGCFPPTFRRSKVAVSPHIWPGGRRGEDHLLTRR